MSCASRRHDTEHAPVRFRTISAVLAPSQYSLPVFTQTIPPPDITPWIKGNCGIEGVHHFEGPARGPHVVITALMHGNEYAGAYALNALLSQKIRPERGKLSLIFLNLKAFEQFDPQHPTRSRFVDEDMNRLWCPDLLRSGHQSYEINRIRAVAPLITEADRVLDLHSMFWDGPPLLLTGQKQKNINHSRAVASALTSPPWVIQDAPCQSGLRLIDHPHFLSDNTQATACLFETGQHWSTASQELACRAAALFPQICGIISSDQRATPVAANIKAPVAAVTHAVHARTDKFIFIKPFRNCDLIRRQGTLLALDGGEEIRTPYDNCLLVIPNLRPVKNHIALRLARAC